MQGRLSLQFQTGAEEGRAGQLCVRHPEIHLLGQGGGLGRETQQRVGIGQIQRAFRSTAD